ncbi:helix-turn-helix domain-containing protein [Marinobacterium stanieri]|uniref:HTH cro/C1-type domain-containing protein n=1 Tax=Marinobacterium stanieri TaxID=49186 RepID=A0A1N6NZW8_9GAMM|nr:helix-turn-helix transcriptional regulator [Marinobacterium stanieri]SIP97593.1 hypothetical protein SAMN05421647_101675 [Marinobacterium stanieri]
MDTMEKGKNARKKPFKWTKELVRLALNDGWTQQDIAQKCRTQQSIVSAWKKGTKKASEAQLIELLKIYGHKLRRSSFRVYWNLDSETLAKRFFKVEGRVILSHAFYDPRRDKHGKLVKKIPTLKLVVHHQGDDQFRAVIQKRITLSNTNEEIECSIEDAFWSSTIYKPMTSAVLINFVDQFANKGLPGLPSDACTLPFIIRQALLYHGFLVEDVEEYPAVW